MTVHEQHHAVTSALRSNNPAHQLDVAKACAEQGRTRAACLLALAAIKAMQERETNRVIGRRA